MRPLIRTPRGPAPGRLCLTLVLGLALGLAPGCRKRQAPAPETDQRPSQPVKILYPAAPGSFVTLVQRLAPSVVQLSTTVPVRGGPADWFPRGSLEDRTSAGEWGETMRRSLGSGFLIDRQGHLLTNAHVVRRAQRITARLSRGKLSLPAELLGLDEDSDVALLKVKPPAGTTLQPVHLGDSSQLQVGEWLLALGDPFGGAVRASAGLLSARESRDLATGKHGLWGYLQTDIAMHAGNSGGPLVNVQGEVVGIATAVDSRGSAGIGFAVPINVARSLLPLLKRVGKADRAWVGLYVDRVTDAWASSAGLPRAGGALVTEVLSGGPAQRAGIRAGDLILSFGGKEINDFKDLPRWAALAGVDQTVPVKVWRDGKTITLSLTTARMPE